jgi:hypothetical protein
MTNGRTVGLGEGWHRLENRRELAQAFMAQPWGPHTSAVQAIVNVMRAAPVANKFALQCLVPYQSWVLVRLPRRRGRPLERVDERIFTSLVEAECAVFAQRWESLFGESLAWHRPQPSAED